MSLHGSSPRGGFPAVVAAMAATFTGVTAEMLPVGVLTPMADGLGVSEGTAGLTMMLPGVTAAVAAPVLVRLTRRADRGRVMWVLMLLLAVSGLVSAWAPNLGVMLAARVGVGIGIGGIWVVASTLAPRLVRAESVPRANALVFTGVSAASVLGVPLGTQVADLAGWRWAFAAGAGLAVLVTVALIALLPKLPPQTVASRGRARGLMSAMLVLVPLVSGHFAAYTYVRPLLERAGANGISALLLAYGVAGVVGNLVVGTRAPKAPTRALAIVITVLAVTMTFAPVPHGTGAALVMLLVWGVSYGGVSVGTQTWLLRVVPGGRETVAAAFTSAFNLAIAAGALAGGIAADNAGVPAPMWLGAGLAALAGVSLAVRSLRTGRASRREAASAPAELLHSGPR